MLFVFVRDKTLRCLPSDVARKYLPSVQLAVARFYPSRRKKREIKAALEGRVIRQSNPFSSLHSGRSIVCSYCRTDEKIVKNRHDRFDLIGIKRGSRIELSRSFHSLSHAAFHTFPGFICTRESSRESGRLFTS